MKDHVVLIAPGGEGIGRALALALAARGARVVVTGAPEKELGETVGYVAFGGGKARHFAGDAAGAVEKAVGAFGAIDRVVGSPRATVELFAAARGQNPACDLVTVPDALDETAAIALVLGVSMS